MKRLAFLLPLAAVFLCLADDNGGASLLPDGPGKDLIARTCTECHSVDRMRSLRISKDDWADKIADMIDRGAKATDEESETMSVYLAQNFGQDSKIRMNTAPMVELRAVLGLTIADCKNIVAYREANGNFKEWSDVLKVPGIDAKKVDEKKDLMLF